MFASHDNFFSKKGITPESIIQFRLELADFLFCQKNRETLWQAYQELLSNKSLKKVRRKDSKLPFSLLSSEDIHKEPSIFIVSHLILDYASARGNRQFKILFKLTTKNKNILHISFNEIFFLKIAKFTSEKSFDNSLKASYYKEKNFSFQMQKKESTKIISYKEICTEGGYEQVPDEIETSVILKYYHITPWMNGLTLDKIKLRQPSLKELLFILIVLARKISHLHDSSIIHGDINTENALVIIDNPLACIAEQYCHGELIDFETSRQHNTVIPRSLNKSEFCLPEKLLPKLASRGTGKEKIFIAHYNDDIFAFGRILCYLFFEKAWSTYRSFLNTPYLITQDFCQKNIVELHEQNSGRYLRFQDFNFNHYCPHDLYLKILKLTQTCLSVRDLPDETNRYLLKNLIAQFEQDIQPWLLTIHCADPPKLEKTTQLPKLSDIIIKS